MKPSEWLEGLRKIDYQRSGHQQHGVLAAAIKVPGGHCGRGPGAGAGLQLFHRASLENQLELKREEESTLKEQFASKAHMAANLELYTQQMKEMENAFGVLLRQLPSDTEVPGPAGRHHSNRAGQWPGVRRDQAAAGGHPAVLHRIADPDHGHRRLSRPCHFRQWRGRVAAYRHPA